MKKKRELATEVTENTEPEIPEAQILKRTELPDGRVAIVTVDGRKLILERKPE